MKKWKSMGQWLRSNKWKVVVPLVVVAALVFAFWYGGNAPGSRGWTVNTPPVPTAGAAGPAGDETAVPTVIDTTPAETEATETEGTAAPAETRPQTAEPETSKPEATEPKATEPKPAGSEPTEPPATEPPTTAPKHVCYVSISCSTILDNLDLCDPDKVDLIPSGGGILWQAEIEFTPGESVFDVLQRACQSYGIHMESEWTPMYNSAYIEGIYNIYEFDVGENSGWMYKVNGWFPNYGSSCYTVEDGDDIRWVYTCDLGYDVGGGYAVG